MVTIAFLIIGGSNIVTFYYASSPVMIFCGLCLYGISAGMVSIPALPELMEVYKTKETLTNKFDKASVETLISGHAVSC